MSRQRSVRRRFLCSSTDLFFGLTTKSTGSPIPLSFGEADTPKRWLMADITDRDAMTMVTEIAIPEFQTLRVVSGSLDQIPDKLQAVVKGAKTNVWVEVKIDAEPSDRSVESRIKEMCADLPVELFAVKRIRKEGLPRLSRVDSSTDLSELKPAEVFDKRLAVEEGLGEHECEWLRQEFTDIHDQACQTTEDAICES